jgi:hypothetical protein
MTTTPVTVSDSALRTPHSPETTSTQAKPATATPHSALTDSDNETWLVRAWRAAKAWFLPPDIWRQPRPSLSDVWAYARHGAWTHGIGPVRRVGAFYALLIALPLHCAGYYLLWITERPSRLAAVLLLAYALGRS